MAGKDDTAVLAEPLALSEGKTAPNRIVYQAMEGNDAADDGRPTETTLWRYRQLAEGTPGLIFIEATAITANGKARRNQLMITEETASGVEKLIAEIRRTSPKTLVLVQITHSGRQSGKGFAEPVCAYPSPGEGLRYLSKTEIRELSATFVRAAVLAEKVGADGIDFKHCHGYLGIEFLRPANVRDDEFGGSFENRTRLFRETVAAMKDKLATREFLIGCRFCAFEGVKGGFGTSGPGEEKEDLTEVIEFVRSCESLGLHYINVSAGIPKTTPWITRPTTKQPIRVADHVRWTETVKRTTSMVVIGSAYSCIESCRKKLAGEPYRLGEGFLRCAAENVRRNRTDMVGVGRQSFADPEFARKILSGETSGISFCTTCGRCTELLVNDQKVWCAVFNGDYRNRYLESKKDGPK